MRTLTKVGVILAACALAIGMCACGSKGSAASGTGTGDNSSLLITSLQKAGTQEFKTVTFGTYEQDGDASNGAEPIEWYVLDEKDGKTLLISKYILDARPYDNYGVGYTWYLTNPRPVSDATWATCSLRGWLGGTFMYTAFTSEEIQKIKSYTSTDTKNFGTTTADVAPSKEAHVESSTDKVFLLSVWEAKTYFDNDDARMATPTLYAISKGVYVNNANASDQSTVGYSPWWTRTVGYYAGYAAVVLEDGYVHGDGYRQDGNYHDGFMHGTELESPLGGNFGVRPCIWVDSSALK